MMSRIVSKFRATWVSMMTIAEFGDILADAGQHPDQLDTIVNAVRQWQQRPDFEDDFSLVMLQV